MRPPSTPSPWKTAQLGGGRDGGGEQRRQRRLDVCTGLNVVETNEREIVGDANPALTCMLHTSNRHRVVGSKQSRRTRTAFEHDLQSLCAVVHPRAGHIGDDELGFRRDAVIGKTILVRCIAFRNTRMSKVSSDETDIAMTKTEQMLDSEAGSLMVVDLDGRVVLSWNSKIYQYYR